MGDINLNTLGSSQDSTTANVSIKPEEVLEPKKLEYDGSAILGLISQREPALSELKNSYDKLWNCYRGKSWWAQDLPLYKVTDTDNQIFPIVQSIIGYISTTFIRDRIEPPTEDTISIKYADLLTNACTDFWRVNRRTSRLQEWLRTSMVKADCFFYMRVETDAVYPFLVDTIDPVDFIEASPTIEYVQDQPWVARRIKATVGFVKQFSRDEKLVAYFKEHYKTDNDEVVLYDFWSKVGLGQNTLVTDNGQVIYERPWPYQTKGGFITSTLYPFFQLRDISVPGASRSLSSVEMVLQMQKLYDKQKAQIWENAEYMGNPPIVVDVESGIDTAKIEGKPRLIIKKYRDGNFTIVPVPPLPGYVERQPDYTRESIQRNMGWNQLMEQGRGGSAREKGAVQSLQRAGFASMDPKVKNLAQAMDDANNILIGLIKTYQFTARKILSLRFGSAYEGFSPSDLRGEYQSRVRIDGVDPERELKRIYEIQTNYKMGLISRKDALRQMGEENVDLLVKNVYEEQAAELEFQKKKQEYIQGSNPTPEKQSNQEEPQVPGELPVFSRTSKPIVPVVAVPEPNPIIQNYVDFIGNIIMSGLRSKLSTLLFEGPVEILEPSLGAINAQQIKIYAPKENDKVKIVEAVPDIAAKIVFTNMKNPAVGIQIGSEPEAQKKTENSIPEKSVVESVSIEPAIATSVKSVNEVPYVTKEEILGMIKKGIVRGIDLKTTDISRYESLPGLYLVEPHAEMVYTKQKKLILKGRPYPNMLDKDFVLIGDKAYGIIRLTFGGKISREDVLALEKLHRVSPVEWKKWWGDKDLYAYTYTFKKFPEPIAYERVPGIQTFQKVVKFIPGKVEGPQAAVITGGLKVVGIKPGVSIPPAKPEKKALTTNEVYTIDRLKEILPADKHPKWDVSEKLDGIRCTAHKTGKNVVFMSDEARKIDTAKLQPIADEIIKLFPYDVVLDGELLLYKGNINLKHQAIAGYIHQTSTPSKEELDGLLYKVFDILYIRNTDVSKKPFDARSKTLDLFLKEGLKGPVQRAKHSIVATANIPTAAKTNTSDEGVVVRAADSSYWHTALMFKAKNLFDIDVKILKKETTKSGAYIYYCALADGTFIGKTYGQKYVNAKPGDIIRINIEHLTLRPNGQISWFAPKPTSKKGLSAPSGPSTTTPGVNRADTIAQIKEVFLAQGGTEQEWKEWLPKFEEWKKTIMPKLLVKINA
jgi:hypothetical protein